MSEHSSDTANLNLLYEYVQKVARVYTSYPFWEDIAGEAFLGVLEKVRAGKFRGDSSLKTFAYLVVRRRVVDFIREKDKMRRIFHKDLMIPDPPSPLDLVYWKEVNRKISKIIKERCSPKERKILCMFYFDERDSTSISIELGISKRRVATLKNSGVRKLLKYYNTEN